MKDKLIQIKLSRLIIGGILLLWFILLVKCKPTTPTVDKYAKEKKEIDSLQYDIFLLKEGQHILTNNVDKQVIVIDSLEEEIITTEKELTLTLTLTRTLTLTPTLTLNLTLNLNLTLILPNSP